MKDSIASKILGALVVICVLGIIAFLTLQNRVGQQSVGENTADLEPHVVNNVFSGPPEFIPVEIS